MQKTGNSPHICLCKKKKKKELALTGGNLKGVAITEREQSLASVQWGSECEQPYQAVSPCTSGFCIGSILRHSFNSEMTASISRSTSNPITVPTKQDWNWVLSVHTGQTTVNKRVGIYWLVRLGLYPNPTAMSFGLRVGRSDQFYYQKVGEYILVNRSIRGCKRQSHRMVSGAWWEFWAELKHFHNNLAA